MALKSVLKDRSPEFVRSAEIMDFKLNPEGWDELGVTLPASIRATGAIEQGRQA